MLRMRRKRRLRWGLNCFELEDSWFLLPRTFMTSLLGTSQMTYGRVTGSEATTEN